MKLKIILLSLCTVLSGGCSKIHVIHHEKVLYPKKTRSGINYVNNKVNLSRIAWWKKLKDPLLNKLLTQALSCNDKVNSSYAIMTQAQAQLKAAQYAWIPTLNATANGFSGGTWNTQATPQGPLAHSPVFSNISNLRFRGYYTGFVPSYSLNVLNIISNIKSAKASLAVRQAEAQSTKLGIISQMSGTYFMLLSQREQLAVEKSLALDLKKLRQLEYVRFQKGASDIETVISIDQQIAQEEAKIPQIENIIAQSENTIHLLLNQNPGPITTRRTLLSLNVNPLIPKYLPSTVLKRRPDIMIALNNVKIACAQLGIAYSAFFPTFSLTGLVGNASIDLSHLLTLSTNVWIAQVTGAMKIFNASAYQQIKSAKAGFYASHYDYLNTVHAAFAEVDNNLTTEQKNRSSYLQTQKGFLAAKRAYAITLAQYKAGAKDYRNAVNAKINLDRTQLTLVQEKAQLLDSIVQVYSAVAGGYDASLCCSRTF